MPGRKLEWIKLRKTTQRQASLQGFYRRIASHEYRALYKWESGFFLSCLILTDMKLFLFSFGAAMQTARSSSQITKYTLQVKKLSDFCVFNFFSTCMGFYYNLQCIRLYTEPWHRFDDIILHFNKLCNLDHNLGLLYFLLQLICNASEINFLDVNRIFIGGSMSLFQHGFWHQCQLWLHAIRSCKSLI